MASNYSVTPKELSSIWRLILNSGDMSFSSARINKAVEDLVGLGEIRKAVADEAKAIAVYGGELATGRSIGTEFSADVPEKIDERYFEGENLKAARTSERMADPARKRLKPVDDIPRDMLNLLSKSFKTVHGKRLFRVARNEYLESIGKPPINRAAAMRQIKGLGGKEAESPLPRAEFIAGVRANKADERRLGSTADPNARPDSRRPAHIPKTGMPLDVGNARFNPAEDAREAMSRLQSPPIPEKTVPLEGGRARTQRDDPESERIASARAAKIQAALRRRLKAGNLSKEEEARIRSELESQASVAKRSIAGSIDVAREKAFGVLERVRDLSDRGRRKLFNIVRERMPATREAAKKIKAKYERGKAVASRPVKLEKGDAKQTPGFTTDPAEIRVSDQQSRQLEAKRAIRGGRRVRVSGKAGLSPRILDEPAELPTRRGRPLSRPSTPPTGPGNELPVGAPDSREALLEAMREIGQSRRLREMESMKENQLLDAIARADASRRPQPRKDTGGAYRIPSATAGEQSPELLARAAALIKKRRGFRPVARGEQAKRILRARKGK